MWCPEVEIIVQTRFIRGAALKNRKEMAPCFVSGVRNCLQGTFSTIADLFIKFKKAGCGWFQMRSWHNTRLEIRFVQSGSELVHFTRLFLKQYLLLSCIYAIFERCTIVHHFSWRWITKWTFLQLQLVQLCNDRRERDDHVNVHLLQEVWGRQNDKHKNPLFTVMIHVLCVISAQVSVK